MIVRNCVSTDSCVTSILILLAGLLLGVADGSAAEVWDFQVQSIDNDDVNLGSYRGKVLLIVNVASKCGLTPQYEQLQQLHEKYADQGLAILAFPCNQFLSQEPGTAKEIKEFCKSNYGVSFDLFAKVKVNGEDACELYRYLTGLQLEPKGTGDISWNFEKFLVDRSGQVIARFAPRTKPDAEEIIELIDAELSKR